MHLLEWNILISNKIWLKFVSKCPIDNNTALVHIMACRRIGDVRGRYTRCLKRFINTGWYMIKSSCHTPYTLKRTMVVYNCNSCVARKRKLYWRISAARQWASSTGLTAVSKFKPRLPAQWAVGTHRKGPSRMEKVTFRMNWPIRNATQIWN